MTHSGSCKSTVGYNSYYCNIKTVLVHTFVHKYVKIPVKPCTFLARLIFFSSSHHTEKYMSSLFGPLCIVIELRCTDCRIHYLYVRRGFSINVTQFQIAYFFSRITMSGSFLFQDVFEIF